MQPRDWLDMMAMGMLGLICLGSTALIGVAVVQGQECPRGLLAIATASAGAIAGVISPIGRAREMK